MKHFFNKRKIMCMCVGVCLRERERERRNILSTLTQFPFIAQMFYSIRKICKKNKREKEKKDKIKLVKTNAN